MNEAATPTTSSGSRVVRVILGLLLVLPAATACLLTFFLPSLNLVSMSFQKVELFGGGSESVGFLNYEGLGEMLDSGDAISMTLTILVIRLVAVLIVPPLLALGVSRGASVPLQIGARLFLTIPAALFAPYVTLSAWFLAMRPEDPGNIRSVVLLGDGIITLTLACAVTLPAYLAALNKSGVQSPEGKTSWRAFATIWVMSLLAAAALSAQAFAISYITQGGPARSTETLMLLLYRVGFQNLKLGVAAALGTLLIGFVMLLGLIAGAIMVWGRLTLQTVSTADRDQGSNEAHSRPIAIGVAMLVLSVVCCALAGSPYAVQLANAPGPEASGVARMLNPGDIGSSLFNSVFPQVLGVFLLQLPLTYLAALGIGGVRPFGRFSEFLLLPFSPWLFATVGPLMIVFFLDARNMGSLDSMIGLVPRFAISVPMLFILTLFFKGQEMKRQAAKSEDSASPLGTVLRGLILPSLPLALLLGFAAVLVGMQSIEWPLVVANSPDKFTLPVLFARLIGQFGMRQSDLGQLLIMTEAPIIVVFLLTFAVFQVFYLPRLSLVRRDPAVSAAEPDGGEMSAKPIPDNQA